jgi:hypothetical protein
MTIEQTIEIPADGRLHLDLPLPKKCLSGKVKMVLHLNPDDSTDALDVEITANPPDFEEFCRLCAAAKQLDFPQLHTCEDILDEAAKQAKGGSQALEYRRMAKRIRYYSEHRELWDETTRMIREIRDEWDDPWEKTNGRNG